MDRPLATPAATTGSRRHRRAWLWVTALTLGVATSAVLPLEIAEAQTTKTVVLMGDSLLNEGAPDITAALEKEGYSVDSSLAVNGAGILDTQIHWLAKARRLINDEDPSVVVVEYVGNYAVFGGVKGISVYSRPFYTLWGQASQRLENVLTARGASVDWVIGPPVGLKVPEEGIKVFDRIYAHLHAPNTPSGRVPLIDVTPAVTDGTGHYTASVSGPDGHMVQVRQSDGVHFTDYGASLFANAIVSALP
ncbi:MAG: hypothetical protein ACRDV6_10490 [Acidimicrobiales bacterium]